MNVLKPTFGQRRSGCAKPYQRSNPHSVEALTSHRKRRSERECRWCVCYVHSKEYGQDVVREAVILDLSDIGARVRCRSRAAFPENVRLRAPRLGLDVQARTVWQEGFDTGIAFEI